MKHISFFYRTHEHLSGLALRITLTIVMLPHGLQLLFGWFGGNGFSASMNYLTDVEGLPWIIGFMVILLQSFGSILILLGAMGRLLSLAMIFLFIGMIVTSHWHHGFFMNWFGNQQGEGFEYHLLAIGLSTALLLNGSGAYSIDARLTRKLKVDADQSFDLEKIYQ
jgi:putative oxidoreductase